MSLGPRLSEVMIEVLKHNLDSLFEWLRAGQKKIAQSCYSTGWHKFKDKIECLWFHCKKKNKMLSPIKYMSKEVVKL